MTSTDDGDAGGGPGRYNHAWDFPLALLLILLAGAFIAEVIW